MLGGGEHRASSEQRGAAGVPGQGPDPGQHDGDEDGKQGEQREQAQQPTRRGAPGPVEQAAELARDPTEHPQRERRARVGVLLATQLLAGGLPGRVATELGGLDQRPGLDKQSAHERLLAAAASATSRPSARIRRST